jgi:hypothetical protein
VHNLLSVKRAINGSGNIRKDKLFFGAGGGNILGHLGKAEGLLLLPAGGSNSKLVYDFNFAACFCRKNNCPFVLLDINSQTSVLFQSFTP